MTAWVASGVMSLGANPVPPVVRIRSRRSSSGPGDQGGRNLLPVVGNDLVLRYLGAGDTVEHQVVDGGAADVGSFAAGAAITTGQDADGDAGALLAVTVPVSFVGVFSSHAFLLPPGRVPCCG